MKKICSIALAFLFLALFQIQAGNPALGRPSRRCCNSPNKDHERPGEQNYRRSLMERYHRPDQAKKTFKGCNTGKG